jgi:hypothetical protein
MAIDPQLFAQAQGTFNSIRILKGQTTAIATCDREGQPNVAPIGSMRVVNADTVHVLHGMLPRTMKNLEANPRATFSVTVPMTLWGIIGMIGSRRDAAGGYRLYCRFEGVDTDPDAISQEVQAILRRVPLFLRRQFRKFCDANLRRVLKFKIIDLRVT